MQECLRILGQNYETLATVQRNIGSFNDVHIIIAEKIYRRVWHNKNSYLDQVGKGPSLYYVSIFWTFSNLTQGTHPLDMHKYVTERQQTWPFSKLTHPFFFT